MPDESLFEYYDMSLTGEIVSNAETDNPTEPELPDLED